MTTRLSFPNGLPPRISARVAQAFLHLDCAEPPLPAITKALGEFAQTYGIADAAPIERVFSLLVAANHSSDRLTGPPAPLPTNAPQSLPSPTEWLLLASRERALASLPELLGPALDAVIAELDAPDSPGKTLSIVDYSLGAMFAAIAQKGPDSPEFVVGNALGKLARLMIEVLLGARPSMPLLRPILLRFVVGTEPRHLAARLDTAVAMACKPAPDKLPFLSFLGNVEVRSSLTRACESWRDLVLHAVGATNPLAVAATSIRDGIVEKLNSLRFFGFAKPPAIAPELERAVTLARSALASDPELRDAWEIQRWGDWATEPRVGGVFPMALCLLGSSRAGNDESLRIGRAIFESRRADGWRYYADYADIPPDTDDLGLMLRLFGRLPDGSQKRNIFERSFELVRLTMEVEDGFPVWLRHGLVELPSPQAPLWQGPRCIAVAAQFVLGMVEAEIEGHDDLKIRAIEWICESWEQHGKISVFHYTIPFAHLLLAKLARAFRGAPQAFHSARLQTIATNLTAEIRLSSNDDGGWGSPLATACHLAVLAMDPEPFHPDPGLVYLASRQRHDGLWPAESLYLCPGKDGAPAAHGAAVMTTGVCLDALIDVRARIERGS